MRKFILLLMLAHATIAHSQTLFTYGNNIVDKQEFLRAYNKNPNTTASKENSLKEYLDLYINFKLKVAAAKNAHLDTLPQLQYELQAFKNQIQDAYLSDEKEANKLIDEAFIRSQKDLHVQLFSVPVDSSFIPSKISEEIYAALQKGNNDYEAITQEMSKKHGYAIKTKDLGFVTAFSLPYEYENIIYALKKGETSQPYESKNNIYLFKIIDERKAIGKWKVAQILLALPPNYQQDTYASIQSKADSIYQQLKNNADFAQMAKQYSNDKTTYLNAGEMPEFGSGKYDLSFEKEVIKLEKNGDISKPFTTPYGFHIVKRISHTPIPATKNADEAFLYALKEKLKQDARMNIIREKLVRNIMQPIGFKKNNAVKEKDLFSYADSVAINKNFNLITQSPISNKVIFSFAKSDVKGSSWLNFIKDYKMNTQLYKGESYPDLLKKYINIATLDYYKKHLEEYNSQFAYQVQEFKEGNMLFEMMERNVWSQAGKDSVGLKKYFDANKGKYLWPASAEVIIFNCDNILLAQKIRENITDGKDWGKIEGAYIGRVVTDSGRYELAQLPLNSNINITEGLLTTPWINDKDSIVSFVKILKIYPANQPRSFEQARGLVINDYQNEMEQKWLADLRKKYPVKINQAVFKSLLKE